MRDKMMAATLLAAAICLCSGNLAKAEGEAKSKDTITGLAVQPDGKIIASGTVGGGFTHAVPPESFGVARYESDGSLDQSFGEDGKSIENFGTTASARAVVLQPDGKIVVAGCETSDEKWAIARFNPDGSLDSTFSGGGLLIAPVPGCVIALALQSNGDIVAAGSGEGGTVAEFTSEGNLETSFGDEGLVTGVTGGYESPRGVAVDSSGNVIVVGEGGDEEMEIVRLTPEGTYDTSFSGDGSDRPLPKYVGGHPVDWSSGRAVTVQADEKIVVVGDSGDAYTNDYTVFRYNPDGTLDSTFSGDGIATADFGGFDIGDSVAIQPNGAILAGGEGYGEFGVARFLSDGSLDPSFGVNGTMSDHPETPGEAMALQGDGKILVGGSTFCCSDSSDFLLSRYTATGEKDVSFGTGGDVTTDLFPEPVEEDVEVPKEEVSDGSGSGGSPGGGSGANVTASASPQHPQSISEAGIGVVGGRALVKGGVARLEAKCAGTNRCHGVAKLIVQLKGQRDQRRKKRLRTSLTRPHRGRTRTLVIGRGYFQIQAGERGVIRIKLSGKGKALLAHAGRHGLVAKLVGSGLRSRAVRLKAQSRKRKRASKKGHHRRG